MQRRVNVDLDPQDEATLAVVAAIDDVPIRAVVEKALTNYLAGRRHYPPIERAVRDILAGQRRCTPDATTRDTVTTAGNIYTIPGR
ncbi:MAG: hypothetical protein ACYCS4_07735 [Acidimicrobiales bacterium]